MIKLFVTAATIWLTVFNAMCQENAVEIKIWQEQHPEILFVSFERLNLLSPTEREYLEGREVIFFEDNIQVEDLYEYESNSTKIVIESHYTREGVKQWISIHPEVKLVKKSTYENSPILIQEEYQQCSNCLILKGEFLTLSDIENYESEKL